MRRLGDGVVLGQRVARKEVAHILGGVVGQGSVQVESREHRRGRHSKVLTWRGAREDDSFAV